MERIGIVKVDQNPIKEDFVHQGIDKATNRVQQGTGHMVLDTIHFNASLTTYTPM